MIKLSKTSIVKLTNIITMKNIINRPFLALVVLGLLLGSTVPQQVSAVSNSSSSIDSAREAEYQIFAEYALAAPKIPTKKVKGTAADIEYIKNLVIGEQSTNTYSQARNFMSSKSMEMFDQTPLFVSDINTEAIKHTYSVVKIDKPRFFKGLQYAKVKVQLKNERNKKSREEYILIKENGVWKLDYVQLLRKELGKYIN